MMISLESANLRQHQIHTSPIHYAEKEKDMKGADPRVSDIGRAIEDDFATIKDCYATPKHPIVLAHGLFGFDELRLAGSLLPGVQYWRGITDALRAKGIEVITASVPSSASIEERAEVLGKDIAAKANGKSVNIIAHSMGGLDARYMISRLQPENVEVLSLTTIASPHRGSAFADYCFDESWWHSYIPGLVRRLNELGVSTGAFSQLTRRYMMDEFNPKTPDDPTVRYFSYGATCDPKLWSAFRRSHAIVQKVEGPNDGLVSVESSRWGTYKGTLVDVSHLDLINWTNRLRWLAWEVTGNVRKFNAIAFYLDIADMLAKEGL
ncbi:Triacylglycerol lipase protein [Rutstroemia sp. NJR-2017a BBW]|nr:Triacylglycerol lipase protein [Rutstroemia sp. NJR-2017a BBW]